MKKKLKAIVISVDLLPTDKGLTEALALCRVTCPTTAVMLVTKDEKMVLLSAVSNKSVDCSEWIKKISSHFGAKGGGKAESAQGKILDPSKYDEIVEFIKKNLD